MWTTAILRTPAPHSSTRRIELVQEAIQRQITLGYTLGLLHGVFPELGSTLTDNEVDLAHHYPFRESPDEVAHAHQLTKSTASPPPDSLQR